VNDAVKVVILLRKDENFFDGILKEYIRLEDNGDFGPMNLLKVDTMDLIRPLVCNNRKD
jgi:hypothetical protein